MIHSIDIRNFRCFRHVTLRDWGRLNVVVGDNGAGKTALLESIFLPLGCSSEIGARLRAQRGLDGSFQGTASRIESALWGGFFHNHDMSDPISLTLEGDGVESRSLEIVKADQEAIFSQISDSITSRNTSVIFNWRDSGGQIKSVKPTIEEGRLAFPSTGEDLPHFHYYPANQTIGSMDVASKFSELSQQGRQGKFLDLFRSEYPWIEDLTVEVYGGSPVLFAKIKGGSVRLPLPNVSSGINRVVAFMLAIASSEDGIVIIDEMDNGIYYSHLGGIWSSLIKFIREYNCQLVVSTHSQECLGALAKALKGRSDDVRLWRLDRRNGECVIDQFSGHQLMVALDYNEEVR